MTAQFNLQQEIVVHIGRTLGVTLPARHYSFHACPSSPEREVSPSTQEQPIKYHFNPQLIMLPPGINILPQPYCFALFFLFLERVSSMYLRVISLGLAYARDDAHDSRGHLVAGGRRRCVVAQAEQTFPPRGRFRHKNRHLADRIVPRRRAGLGEKIPLSVR